MLTQGVTFLGGVLVVFGLVNLGMTIKDGMQGGGGQLSGAIAMIVGGASWSARPSTSARSTPDGPLASKGVTAVALGSGA